MILNYFLFLLSLIMIAGLALDAGILEWRNNGIQQAADAAAQEAMYERGHGNSAWVTAGQAQAALNGYTNGVNGATVSIVNPPNSGTYASDTWSVQSTVAQTTKNLFMGLVNGGSSTLVATATAKILPTCIWIMNPGTNSANGSLQVASASLHASNCGIYVNTNTGSSENLRIDGFGHLTATRIRVAGSSTGNASTGSVSPTPIFNAAGKFDPFAYVTSPTLTSCTYNNTSYFGGGPYTLSPGSYCGGIDLAYTNVTLNPGLYIIAGGMSGYNVNLYGTGVTLYFTKKSSDTTYAAITFSSTSSSLYGVYLNAAASSVNGAIPGIVMFADRSWVDHGNQDFQFAFVNILGDGYWYLPNTGLYTWAAPMSYTSYSGLVIDNYYQFGSTTTFHSDLTAFGGVSPLHYEDGVLVQ